MWPLPLAMRRSGSVCSACRIRSLCRGALFYCRIYSAGARICSNFALRRSGAFFCGGCRRNRHARRRKAPSFWKRAFLEHCGRRFYGNSTAAVYAGSAFCFAFILRRAKRRRMGDFLQRHGLVPWHSRAGLLCQRTLLQGAFCGALRFVYFFRRGWLCIYAKRLRSALYGGARRRACNKQRNSQKIVQKAPCSKNEHGVFVCFYPLQPITSAPVLGFCSPFSDAAAPILITGLSSLGAGFGVGSGSGSSTTEAARKTCVSPT